MTYSTARRNRLPVSTSRQECETDHIAFRSRSTLPTFVSRGQHPRGVAGRGGGRGGRPGRGGRAAKATGAWRARGGGVRGVAGAAGEPPADGRLAGPQAI